MVVAVVAVVVGVRIGVVGVVAVRIMVGGLGSYCRGCDGGGC